MSAGAAHRLALLEKGEAKCSPAQLAIWRTILESLPESPLVGIRGGYGLEIFLLGRVMRSASRWIGNRRRQVKRWNWSVSHE